MSEQTRSKASCAILALLYEALDDEEDETEWTEEKVQETIDRLGLTQDDLKRMADRIRKMVTEHGGKTGEPSSDH